MTTRRVEVVLQLPRPSGSKLQHELGAFARYCVMRIERDIGAREYWRVTIAATVGGTFASLVVALDRGVETVQRGVGHDAALAIWDAMCRIEETLRERASAQRVHDVVG